MSSWFSRFKHGTSTKHQEQSSLQDGSGEELYVIASEWKDWDLVNRKEKEETGNVTEPPSSDLKHSTTPATRDGEDLTVSDLALGTPPLGSSSCTSQAVHTSTTTPQPSIMTKDISEATPQPTDLEDTNKTSSQSSKDTSKATPQSSEDSGKATPKPAEDASPQPSTMIGDISEGIELGKPSTFTVTPQGGKIQYHKVTVSVPKKAVAAETSIKLRTPLRVDGSTQYPDGVVPISAVLEIHPTDKIRKPITVTMPHFLSDMRNVQTLGVLKATRDETGQYEFKKLDTNARFTKDKVTFTLSHFCYLQLYAEAKPKKSLKFKYCICPIVPDFSRVSSDTSFRVYYSITYFDHIFLMALESQCKTIPRLAEFGYHIDHDMMKEFTAPHGLEVRDFSPDPFVSRPDGSGWNWDTLHKAKELPLHPSDHDQSAFQFWANEFLYPPTYVLAVCGSGGTTRECTVTVTFHVIITSTRLSVQVQVQLPSGVAAPKTAAVAVLDTDQVSPEFTVIRRCYSALTISLKPVCAQLGDLLYSKGLIPSTVLDFTRGVYLESEKAQKIVDTVRDSIKLDPSKFHKFLEALEENGEPQAKDIYKKLHDCYKAEKGKYVCEVFDEHKTELIGEIRPREENVRLRLYNLAVIEAGPGADSAECIFSLVKEKVKREPAVFSDVCTALSKAGINRRLVEDIRDKTRARYPDLDRPGLLLST